jgi:hypothetical protein
MRRSRPVLLTLFTILALLGPAGCGGNSGGVDEGLGLDSGNGLDGGGSFDASGRDALPDGGASSYATTQYTSMTYPGYFQGSGTYSCPPPADPNYQQLPMNLYVPNLPSGGTVPLLLFFPGTADDLNLDQLKQGLPDAVVHRAAELGFAAAAVAYRSLDFNLFYPDRMDAKEKCVWRQDPLSAVAQLCGNQGPLAASATIIDCKKGIVVAGHSQGGLMALMAANYDSRVAAAYTLGAGAGYDSSNACAQDLTCGYATVLFPHVADPAVAAAQKGPLDSFVMGSSSVRVLSSDAIRAEAGDVDPYFRPAYLGGAASAVDVVAALNNILNLGCAATSPGSCLRGAGNGSGWFLVASSELTPCAPNTACTASASHAGHCFFSFGDSIGCTNNAGLSEEWDPDPTYFGHGLTTDWSLDANLTWLMGRTH